MKKLNALLLSFSRKTSGQAFVPEIDGLRFLAIITVLIFHLNTAFSEAIGSGGAMAEGADHPLQPGWWIIRMDLGVKVFFAISGFILAIPFLQQYWFGGKRVVLKAYLVRRLTRLEPPYIIAMLMFFAVHVVVLGVPFAQYLPNLGASLIYAHNFIFGRSSLILPVAWSLEVEVQFYLLVPLIAALFFKKDKKWRAIIWISALLLITILTKNYIMRNDLKHIGSSILVYFSHFAVGIMFSMIYLLKPKWIVQKHVAWDVLGLIGFFMLFYFYKPQVSIGNNIVFNLAIFSLFVAVFKGTYTNAIYRQPLLFVIGGMCYTIYLIHFPLLMLFVKVSRNLAIFEGYYANYALQFILLIPLVITISGVFFKLFEQPFMDKHWPDKLAVALKRFNRKRD